MINSTTKMISTQTAVAPSNSITSCFRSPPSASTFVVTSPALAVCSTSAARAGGDANSAVASSSVAINFLCIGRSSKSVAAVQRERRRAGLPPARHRESSSHLGDEQVANRQREEGEPFDQRRSDDHVHADLAARFGLTGDAF